MRKSSKEKREIERVDGTDVKRKGETRETKRTRVINIDKMSKSKREWEQRMTERK